MRTTIKIMLALLAVAAYFTITATENRVVAQKKHNVLKIGTYDSRIITFAYSRSAYFADLRKKQDQEYNDAQKADNNTLTIDNKK